MDLDVTSLHHRRAVHRWERMSVGDLIERVTWSRPDKPAIVGRPGAYAGFGFALSLTRGLRLESDLKLGTYLPLIYHVGDQPFTYSVFLCGRTLVLGRRPNPEHIAEMIAAEQVTALWAGSPAMVRALDATLTARPELEARSVTVIVYGWAALPPATLASMKRHCGDDLCVLPGQPGRL